jgi:hypothetical protein
MPKIKIIENANGYSLQIKTSWWRRWKYVKRTNGLVAWWSTRKGAQAFINLHYKYSQVCSTKTIKRVNNEEGD